MNTNRWTQLIRITGLNEKQPRRIAVNTFWLLVGRIAAQSLGVLFTIVVARRLGEIGLGQYAFIAALVMVGNVFTTFGLDTYLIREVARERLNNPAILAAALWIQLGLSALFILAINLRLPYLSNKTPETLLALRLYSLALIPLAFTTIFSAVLRAHQRMDLYVFAAAFAAAAQTLGALAILSTGGRLLELAWVLLGVQGLGAGVTGWLCLSSMPGFTFGWRTEREVIGRMLRQSWPLALLAVLGVIYQRLEVLLLSGLAPDAVTGWFSAASRVGEAVKLGHYALLGALFPVLSALKFEPGFERISLNSDRVYRTSVQAPFYQSSIRFLYLFSLIAACMLTIFAGPLISLLYGSAYAPSAAALRILAWSLLPYSYAAQASLKLVTGGKEQIVVQGLLTGLAASSIASFLMIPGWGLAGACWAVVIGETFHALALWRLSR